MRSPLSLSSSSLLSYFKFIVISSTICKREDYINFYRFIIILLHFYFYFIVVTLRFQALIIISFLSYSILSFSTKDLYTSIRLIYFYSIFITITSSLYIRIFFIFSKSSIFLISIKINTIFNTFLNFDLSIELT